MDGIIPQSRAVAKSLEEFKSVSESEPKLFGADMGIHDLNMAIGGHIPKKLTTIAGRSGHGKTASVIPMFKASERVVGGKKPAFMFLTWEMAAEEVVSRYITHETGLSWRLIYQVPWLLTPEQKEQIHVAYQKAKSLPILYQEMSTSFSHIEKISNEFCDICYKKSKAEGIDITPVMIIDYIGMAKFEGSNDLRTYRISELMNNLKGLSKRNDQHTIALAQINRSADDKEMPGRNDLSDSQGIEQASDNLFILHRPEYQSVKEISLGSEKIDSTDKVIFRLLKGRSVGVGDIVMNCEARHSRFWSLDHHHDFDYWELYDNPDFWKKHFGR